MSAYFSNDSYHPHSLPRARSRLIPSLHDSLEREEKEGNTGSGCCDCFRLLCFDEGLSKSEIYEGGRARGAIDDYSIETYEYSDDSSYGTRLSSLASYQDYQLSKSERERREFRAFQQWKRHQKSQNEGHAHSPGLANEPHENLSTAALESASLTSLYSLASHHRMYQDSLSQQRPPRDLFVYRQAHQQDQNEVGDYPRLNEAAFEDPKSRQRLYGMEYGLNRVISPDLTQDKYQPNAALKSSIRRNREKKQRDTVETARMDDHNPIEQTVTKEIESTSSSVRFSGVTTPVPFPRDRNGKRETGNASSSVVSAETQVIKNSSGAKASKSVLPELVEDSVNESIPDDLTRNSTISSMASERWEGGETPPSPPRGTGSKNTKAQPNVGKQSTRFRPFRARKRFATPVFNCAASFDGILEYEEEHPNKKRGTSPVVAPKEEVRSEEIESHDDNSSCRDGDLEEMLQSSQQGFSQTREEHWNHVGGSAIFHTMPEKNENRKAKESVFISKKESTSQESTNEPSSARSNITASKAGATSRPKKSPQTRQFPPASIARVERGVERKNTRHMGHYRRTHSVC